MEQNDFRLSNRWHLYKDYVHMVRDFGASIEFRVGQLSDDPRLDAGWRDVKNALERLKSIAWEVEMEEFKKELENGELQRGTEDRVPGDSTTTGFSGGKHQKI